MEARRMVELQELELTQAVGSPRGKSPGHLGRLIEALVGVTWDCRESTEKVATLELWLKWAWSVGSLRDKPHGGGGYIVGVGADCRTVGLSGFQEQAVPDLEL